MSFIRVLVVDDSAFIRKVVTDILQSDNEIKVVEKARNGKEAIEKLMRSEIDVVTLDVEMPVMNGIETLSEIMKIKPTPVVMLSSLTKQGADLTITALEMGAVDFITKPENIFKEGQEELRSSVIQKIKTAAVIDVKTKKSVFEKIRASTAKGLAPKQLVSRAGRVENIVAIGTSTGGPKALQHVIPNLDEDINSAVVIVQHMPPGFTKSLADRLDGVSKIRVKEAENGEVLKNGVAYIAPGDRHLNFVNEGSDIRVVLDNGANVSGHKPSVDSMFYSLCEVRCKSIIPVIMTGMGQDGAKGMQKLKLKGGSNIISIAEDQDTCVVFGMPKAAINLGVVDKVLPVNKIAVEINKLLGV